MYLNFLQKSDDASNENNFLCGISIYLLQNARPFDYLLQLLLKVASRKNETLRANPSLRSRSCTQLCDRIVFLQEALDGLHCCGETEHSSVFSHIKLEPVTPVLKVHVTLPACLHSSHF